MKWVEEFYVPALSCEQAIMLEYLVHKEYHEVEISNMHFSCRYLIKNHSSVEGKYQKNSWNQDFWILIKQFCFIFFDTHTHTHSALIG